MRNIQFSSAEFGHALDQLIELVTQGMAHVKIARELGGALRDNPAIGQVAPVFWYSSLTSLTFVAQLNAFKLFDRQRNAMTVPQILEQATRLRHDFAKSSPSQVDAIVTVGKFQIGASLAEAWERINSKRNKLLAHFDPRVVTDPKEVADQLKVTFSDLNITFETAASILRELSVGFRDILPSFQIPGVNDFEGLLDVVWAQLQARQE